ncbi:hypothetical protein BDR07DRAFT_430539 [Suillus spraguei]|nr:hypothetical protein BDR07DRAFT_430539 [Suillus spraguei]
MILDLKAKELKKKNIIRNHNDETTLPKYICFQLSPLKPLHENRELNQRHKLGGRHFCQVVSVIVRFLRSMYPSCQSPANCLGRPDTMIAPASYFRIFSQALIHACDITRHLETVFLFTTADVSTTLIPTRSSIPVRYLLLAFLWTALLTCVR